GMSAPEISGELVDLLRCPLTGQDLRRDSGALVTRDGTRRYPVTADGIPLFGEAWLSADGATQRAHYDTIADQYLDNLEYPHTREYMTYLDRALLDEVDRVELGTRRQTSRVSGGG